MYGAGDVRVETVPDPVLQEPTDAVVRVAAAGVCGSDLWAYGSMPTTEQGAGWATRSSASSRTSAPMFPDCSAVTRRLPMSPASAGATRGTTPPGEKDTSCRQSP